MDATLICQNGPPTASEIMEVNTIQPTTSVTSNSLRGHGGHGGQNHSTYNLRTNEYDIIS